MRSASNNRGFSLMEVLCVVGCMAAAIGLFGGTTWHIQSSMQIRNTATEFLQTVKTARQYAVDHRCRTRVAFRSGLFSADSETASNPDERTYRIYAFIIPSSAPADAGRWVPIAGRRAESGGAALTEWARVELTPRSESLVGRWLICPLDSKQRHVSDTVQLTSELFERFRSDDPETFFQDNFHTPETTWTDDVIDPHEAENCFSVFPSDYRRTPADEGPVLITGELPEEETCRDPITDETVESSTFWPGQVQFVRGMNAKKTEDLPGIEFQPDGSLVCGWSRELKFNFASATRPHDSYSVMVSAATGLARIAEVDLK